ncbi:DUF1624 domain-containing protein [Marinicella meishanensis]|uniref:DUF1624 domain-containing protein n=1 Tax=Marinicella meishanensis TaxID=2873263 RepID=UPI001CBAFD1B|nr:heparan-alpha-glucosaminide N-acetyltransferase domain-containing protein [Marinicella sp. NBU2979]
MNDNNPRQRIESLDVLRGLVIVLMAIDHVRDFWSVEPFQPEDLSQTTPEYFFTRWITHFCAPVFVFLAGTSAFLYQAKINDKKQLSRFLLSRGLWLVLIELVVVNSSWTLGFFLTGWGFFLQVIWALGVSMIALALLVWLSDGMILLISLLMIVGHNAFNFVVPADLGAWAWLWQVLHEGGWIALNAQGSYGAFIAYPLIPWIGVMGAGYVFGRLMLMAPADRFRWLWGLAGACVMLFVVLRYSNLYGDTAPWTTQKDAMFTFMSFINTQKYPPSLLFLLMTLGPGFVLLWLFEKKPWRWLGILKTIGRVPLFFYVLHFIVIHLTSMLYFKVVHGQWFDLANTQNPQRWPDFYEPSLWRLYLAWALTVWGFFYLCRWYDRYKSTHRHWWLKFL